jgi:hypothetical protein
MDKTSILKQIKVLLGMDAPVVPPTEPVAATEYTLQDGTVVTISELVTGGAIMVGGEPAPTGEHVLSDGTIIVVAEPGIISEVKPSVPAPEDLATDPAAPTTTDIKAMVEAAVKEAVKEAVEEELKAYKTKMGAQEAASKKMVELMAELLKEPATTPTPTHTQTNFKKAESKTERYARLRNVLETIKN